MRKSEAMYIENEAKQHGQPVFNSSLNVNLCTNSYILKWKLKSIITSSVYMRHVLDRFLQFVCVCNFIIKGIFQQLSVFGVYVS